MAAISGGRRILLLSYLAFAGCAFADRPILQSPLHAHGAHVGGVGADLTVDASVLQLLRTSGPVRLESFPLAGQLYTLDVQRVEPFAPDAQIVLMTDGGQVQLAPPELLIVAGSLVGHSGSTVILSFAPSGVNGYVNVDGRQFLISSGPERDGSRAVAVELTSEASAALRLETHECGADELMQHAPAGVTPSAPSGASTRGAPPCRLATIAIETDQEYLAHFAGDVPAATAYAGTLIGAVSEIYARDFNARLQIGFLRIWETADPWTTNEAFAQIYQFQDYWNANMTHVSRHAAHYLTPRSLSGAGGLAYLPGLCRAESDYGLSAYLNGFFPYPIVNNNTQNWDLMVVAHELGHNFGAPHSHDMSPPIDRCAFGDCSVVPDGTIMSYCHTCAGGMANVRMEFHPRTISEAVLPYLANEAPCGLELQPPEISQQPAGATVCPGAPIVLAVTAAGDGVLSYQWRRNGDDIAGATAATYSIAAYEPAAHAGSYSVRVSNACGDRLSEAAALTSCAAPPADIDANCSVNLSDLAILLSNFGESGTSLSDGDLNGDGHVDLTDLAMLLSSFGSVGC